MNRTFTIFSVFTLAFAVMCSCSHDSVFEQEKVVDVPIPSEGYIFFDIGKSQTRGKDMTGRLENDFSVLAYRYPSSWAAAEPLANQTRRITYADNDGVTILDSETGKDNYMGVFFGEAGKSYTNATPAPQVVKYANATYSYEPLQSWQKNLYYAFFAWYPSSLVVNPGTDGAYNSNHYGNPYIEYTLPADSNRAARVQMEDVVTACKIDYKKTIGGTTVIFENMQHRLAALDIRANNMINAKALKDTYTEFADVSDDAEVTVDVTGLSLNLNGIMTKAVIPLNTDDVTEKMTVSTPVDRTYTGFDGASGIPYYLVQNTDGSYSILKATSLVGEDELLILIPQADDISASLKVDYTVKCAGIEKKFAFSTSDAEPKIDVTIEGGLESGYYHYLLLNFTKSGLFVSARKDVRWEELDDDVEHTFE